MGDEAMTLHAKSNEEHDRQLSTMRHVESVALIIKQHDVAQDKSEKKIVEENERILALEQETTRDLSRNLGRTKEDVDRLQKELDALRAASGESGDQYNILVLQLQQAEQERDATQKELAAQLKREQDAHQQTLKRKKEIADELETEHAARLLREADIQAIQAALE